KARSLGLADSAGFRVCVLRRPGEGLLEAADNGVDSILTTLTRRLPEAMVTVRDFGVIAIVPEQVREPEGAAEADLSDSVQAWPRIWTDLGLDPHVTGGLSERLQRPELAPVGLSQAEQAVDLGLRLGRGGQLIDYHKLGIYRLLLRIGDIRQLWGFADEILGPLISYDAAHGGELVTTLSVYLRNQSSPKQTARALRVHANTIAYRARRIETITGLDLDHPDDRLLAQVAVTILESQIGHDGS
ncbi:MAG: helix-turn-helix domain-containing protein, partial [Actinomycetota bacterium]|nr:helix-turn-helix domain-containing protein [Actinomycetota bacterium]